MNSITPFNPSLTPKNPSKGRGKGRGYPPKVENTKVVTVVRLDKDVYDQLEKAVGHIQVTPDSKPELVAYQLGIQKVLQELRRGFTIGY
jgi:CxxC motif-containing protein (DUF1111 family)